MSAPVPPDDSDADNGGDASIDNPPSASPGYSTPPPEGLHHGEDGE